MWHFLKASIQKNNVSKDLILLLLIGGLYSLAIFLSNTFVNVYLWKQSNDFYTIATYNVAIVLFQMFTFILAGRLAKQVDRIIVLRLGVIFLAVFFITVLLTGAVASTYSFLLGGLLGIGYGFYWLAFNVLTFEITEPETRDLFNGFLGGLESFAGMIGPFIAGIIISNMFENIGYIVIFSISLSLFLIAIVCSFFLKRRGATNTYHLQYVWREIQQNKNWLYILSANFFQGLRDGIFVFAISILIFIITNDEFSLGMFNVLICFSSVIFYIIITKLVGTKRRNQTIMIGSTLLSLAIFIFIFQPTYTAFLCYAVVIGIAYPMINVPFNSMTYDVIGLSTEAANLRIEYIVVLEVISNLGRLCSIVLFMIGLLLTSSLLYVYIFLACFSQAYFFIYYFARKVSIKTVI